MPAPPTPYSSALGDKDPLDSIRNSIEQIQTLTGNWPANRFERSYAPGKWTARQVLTHLAQTELMLGNRARMAVITPKYVAQNFDQDAWIALDAGLPGRAATGRTCGRRAHEPGIFRGVVTCRAARPPSLIPNTAS